ncbi:MAG TPA: malto-oligosyltrehalose trehalohydrolase [Devosia sp.]
MSTARPGAIPHANGTQFRVWAEGHRTVTLEIEGRAPIHLMPVGDGYFEIDAADVGVGARYRYRIDGGPALPDLASRAQPEGSEGPSVVTDFDFSWTDQDWPGVLSIDQVIYELHIGTFTPQGTWRAAIDKLDHLRQTGITILHIMPVGTFKGKFGWGYDTILPYAPFAAYGTPEDMAAFVDAAHAHGIGVILDVVYNHVGMGDCFASYSEHYFTDRYENEWGPSFNFDGEHSHAVRQFITQNAVQWIADYHIDGLRLDATQALFDSSRDHIIAEFTRAVRKAAGSRSVYVLAENQPYDRTLTEHPEEGGYGVDAIVSDDFHHSAHVAATGHNDFYYRDYLGTPQEFVSAFKYGFVYQGQRSTMREQSYGTYNLDTPPNKFVQFLENHDQVANSARGFRLADLVCPARCRALTTMLLLAPQTPCLFQGQEWGASNPFLYFLGLEGEDAAAVAKGRRQSLMEFPSVQDPAILDVLTDPADEQTFLSSKLDWAHTRRTAAYLALHTDLLQLRRTIAAFSQRSERHIDGAVIGDEAFLIRFFTVDPAEHRLLLVNFGRDLPVGVVAEPLLAPPRGRKWTVEFSSEHPRYDGAGRRPIDPENFWTLPSDTAIVFASGPRVSHG